LSLFLVEADGSLTTLQTLATLDFYLVFVPFIFAAGVQRLLLLDSRECIPLLSTHHFRRQAGLLVINNLGEVVRSLDGGSLEKNLYVAGLSVLGCIGRFTVGSLSDRLYFRPLTSPVRVRCVRWCVCGVCRVMQTLKGADVAYSVVG
jgi:hypothetical protein